MSARSPTAALSLSLLGAVLLAACPAPPPVPDAGTAVDSGVAPACDSPEDCRAQGFEGACRRGVCTAQVPCFDDAECGLGESCVAGVCRFTGCTEDSQCAVGRCRPDVYACTECANDAQCPAVAPVCTDDGHCVKCQQDSDCHYPGAPYCEVDSGACLYCLKDAQCPNGLHCGQGGICEGAQKNAACNGGIACDLGLMCVNIGDRSICLEACNLYTPQCTNPEICLKLTFQDSPSLVFDQGAPVGVCYPPFQGARGYHESCNDNCQPNLACLPDGALQSSCKQYCDPLNPYCGQGEKCHPWPGDYQGHQYGLCYPDNGYGSPCDGDLDCRTGQACVPRDDPSSSTDLSNACAFAAGAAPGLSPCLQDADCQSGSCRANPLSGGPGAFCFAACTEDADCSVGGRQGYCEGEFLFTTRYVLDPGQPVRGCIPSCAAPKDCTAFDPGFACVAELDLKSHLLRTACAPAKGQKLAGESCTQEGECRDGFCLLTDGRGVARQGVCTNSCVDPGDCALPQLPDGGGAARAQCADTALFAGPGAWATASLCGGASCGSDADCVSPYSRCTAQPDPASPMTELVTVCSAPSSSGTLDGGAACVKDGDCQSGVCAEEVGGSGKRCLQPCVQAQPDCPVGTTCQSGALRVMRPDGTFQSFDACAP